MNASAASPEEYYRFFNTLPSFQDPALVSRTLRFALSADARSQDTPLLIAQMLGSPGTQEATWAFVKEEWPKLVTKLGTFQGIPNIVGGLSGFCSAERAGDIREFFETHPVREAFRPLQQALERVDACAELHGRQSPAFTRWLAAHPSS